MYLFFGIFFLALLLFFCLNYWRKKKIIRKICSMCMDEKCRILNELTEPFGYTYVLSQDIFTSRTDAWQKEFGYCALYDEAAPHFNMVFDSLPVYFDYGNRTWLVEFWKGQYGINTGCEAGVYRAGRILNEEERKHTLFECVDEENMLQLSFTLVKDSQVIAKLCCRHWWLAAFRMGCFSMPAGLIMHASVTFPDDGMAEAFAEGLHEAGYAYGEIHLCCRTAAFVFSASAPICGIFKRIRIRAAQWCNRLWCRIYLFVTRPFCLSVDRILYLYYYLPFAFRRMFRIRKYKKHRRKRAR